MTRLLAAWFKDWRWEQRLTLRECESLLGLSNAYLSQFENGKSGITLENAEKIFFAMLATGRQGE